MKQTFPDSKRTNEIGLGLQQGTVLTYLMSVVEKNLYFKFISRLSENILWYSDKTFVQPKILHHHK